MPSRFGCFKTRRAIRIVYSRFAGNFYSVEVWEMQTRLLNRKPQQIRSIGKPARFCAGIDFNTREKSGDDTTQGMGTGGKRPRKSRNDLGKRSCDSQYNAVEAKSACRAWLAEPVVKAIK